MENYITILGSLDQKKLWRYMKASDVFVLNTNYQGMPRIIIEAMHLGVPVITTDVGGNGEVVINGVNGLLVEYRNQEQLKQAMTDLLNNPTKRKELADRAKDNLEKFSQQRMIHKLLKLFADTERASR